MISRTVLIAIPGALAFASLGGCVSSGPPKQLTEQQVCLAHHHGNAAEEDRCRLDPELQRGSPPDARPQDLPIRTKQPGD